MGPRGSKEEKAGATYGRGFSGPEQGSLGAHAPWDPARLKEELDGGDGVTKGSFRRNGSRRVGPIEMEMTRCDK